LLLTAWDENFSQSSAQFLTDLLRVPVPFLFVGLKHVSTTVQMLVVFYRFNQHDLRAALSRLKRNCMELWMLPLEDETDAASVDVAAWATATAHLGSVGFYGKSWSLNKNQASCITCSSGEENLASLPPSASKRTR
jgi:hypothetical protein